MRNSNREMRHTTFDPNHFSFPRRSGIPHGYFGREPAWRRGLRALFSYASFVVAALVISWVVMNMGVMQ